MGGKPREALDRAIGELAVRQHCVATRRQLLALGMSPDAIDNRLRDCRLRPLYRGVYLVGPVPPPHARAMAAALACGDRAVLSHRSAAHLWGLLPYPAHERTPHVTIPDPNADPRRGIRLHRVSHIGGREVTRRHRIPVVTPARALLDLAAIVDERELERAFAEALARRRVTRAAVEAVLVRNGRRAGTGALRTLMRADDPPPFTRSEAEERLLRLIRGSALPRPVVNARLGPYEADFLWREQRLIVEVDGFQFHSSRQAFESDRRRDAELQARGYRVMRVTWRQILTDPEGVMARLTQALHAAVG